MSEIWLHFQLPPRLEGLPPFEELTCIDLGCGTYNSDVARQVLDIPWMSLTSVDCYKPDLDVARTKPCKAKEWYIKDNNVFDGLHQADVILSFDVLEHLTKEDGLRWLNLLDLYAKKRIVLFLPVEPADFFRKNIWPENPAQEHLSHWRPHELDALGYKTEEVFGCHSELKEDGSTVSFGAVWAIKDIEKL